MSVKKLGKALRASYGYAWVIENNPGRLFRDTFDLPMAFLRAFDNYSKHEELRKRYEALQISSETKAREDKDQLLSLQMMIRKNWIEKAEERSKTIPVPLQQKGNAQFCLYGGAIYKFDRVGYTEEQMTLQVMELEDAERQKFERLRHKFSVARQEEAEIKRERVSEEVRIAVWRRDGGKCVRCGGRERLEYDHIVPLSKGGSNTVRNIELLCEECNRQKGNRV